MTSPDESLPITAVVMTKNEERVIARTVKGLDCFAQVVVVDSNSLDETVRLATANGARVINFTWNGDYPKKKQWILEHAALENDWVLYVDADELPSGALIEDLRTLYESGRLGNCSAYDVPLSYTFQGSILAHGHKIYKRALVHRARSHFPPVEDLQVSNMWEVEGHYQPAVKGTVGVLASPMLHHDLDPLFDFFARHNRYSDWEAHLLVNERARRQVEGLRAARGRIFRHLPFKPLLFFIYAYFLKRGFLDGTAGLDYAIAYSFYLWQTSAKVRELRRREAGQE